MIFVVNQAVSRSKLKVDAVRALSQRGPLAPVDEHNRVEFAASMTDGRTACEVPRSRRGYPALVLYCCPPGPRGEMSQSPKPAARRLERLTHRAGMHGGALRRAGIVVLCTLLYRGPSPHGVCGPRSASSLPGRAAPAPPCNSPCSGLTCASIVQSPAFWRWGSLRPALRPGLLGGAAGKPATGRSIAMKRRLERNTPEEEAVIQRGIAADSGNSEWTSDDVAAAKSAAQVLGQETVAALIRRRGPQKTPLKQAVSLRLDAEVVMALRSSGPGWQSRVNAVLRKAVLG